MVEMPHVGFHLVPREVERTHAENAHRLDRNLGQDVLRKQRANAWIPSARNLEPSPARPLQRPEQNHRGPEFVLRRLVGGLIRTLLLADAFGDGANGLQTGEVPDN